MVVNAEVKQVVFDINEQLWLEAKSKAAIEDIPLKDWVARAIQNELEKTREKTRV
jgi:uncharacterized membrane protein